MTQKLRWSYDRKFKQWYVLESAPYANDGVTITRMKKAYQSQPHIINYELQIDGSSTVFGFNRLMNAKKVAELIRFG